jgi:hypothetical protein
MQFLQHSDIFISAMQYTVDTGTISVIGPHSAKQSDRDCRIVIEVVALQGAEYRIGLQKAL